MFCRGGYVVDPIQLLNEYTDLATKQMLMNVVVRKQKFDKMEKRLFYWQVMTISALILFLLYLWFFIIRASNYSFALSISEILENQMHLFVLIVIGFGFGMIHYLEKKKDKAEKEYHDLRCEIIKKSTDLWQTPAQWEQRHEVFDMMKKEFDINLYHESK